MLETIRDICNQHPACDAMCPLYDDDKLYRCMLDLPPAFWNIEKIREIELKANEEERKSEWE